MTHYDLGCDTALIQLGFAKTAGAVGAALNESANDYVDLSTGQAVSPAKLVLKQLGLGDYPEVVSLEQYEQTQNPLPGTATNPPAPIKTSAFRKFSTTGLMMDEPPRESPEWIPPPTPQHHRHHQLLDDPGFQESEVPQGNVYADTEGRKQDDQPIPGDNEAPGSVSGGAGPQMSGSGAEVMVPDQTPQRQAMSLYDTPSSDVGGIFNFFDQRLQNPATNSIIRFVSE